MDNLTHTLVGAAMADAGLRHRTPLAATTLMIGANLPDLDILSYIHSADAALGFRRGWTHGVLALAVLPVLLTAVMLLFDRWRRRHGRYSAARPRQLLLLAYLGVLSHPLLDWLNTYGVRFLMPFDGSWFYGDTLFIIDPWLWLLLGGTSFLLHSRSRRGLRNWAVLAALTTIIVLPGTAAWPPARWIWIAGLAALIVLRIRRPAPASGRQSVRTAWGALAATGLYIVLMAAGSRVAQRQVLASLPQHELDAVEDVMVGPVAANPFARAVVLASPEAYRFGTFDWLGRPRWQPAAESLSPPPSSPVVEAALEAPCIQGIVNWARYPWVEVDAKDDGWVVYLMDARYTRSRTRGFGGGSVELSSDLADRCDTPTPRAP